MADLKYYDVLLKPIVTEKSMAMQADKKYTFSVNTDATKTQIKEAVEKMFKDVKVLKVNTMNLDGKLRRRGNTQGRRSAVQMAIVQLTADSAEIDLFYFTSSVRSSDDSRSARRLARSNQRKLGANAESFLPYCR